jgi:hypothetical protein
MFVMYALRVPVLCIATLMVAVSSAAAFDGQLRPAESDDELKSWLQNMVWHHRFTTQEIQQVTGLEPDQIAQRLQQFNISADTRPDRPADKMFVLPYPGGRHPRIGFLDGAIEPQRETKLSVFCPWDDHSYAVMDIPEAIWSNLGLTYLAHTHIDTVWSAQGIDLQQQEWKVLPNGAFEIVRRLPNGIEFGTKVIPLKDHLRMKMWLTNGTDKPLSDLRVQNCVMLKGMEGFTQQDNDNKLFVNGYAIARSPDADKWIISAWDPVHRAWGNTGCPCLHSDPKFPDCAPGETKWLRGWFSFYQGTDIDAELARIEATNWRTHPLHHVTGNVTGKVRDSLTGKILPCRLYVQNSEDSTWHYAASTAVAGSAVQYRRQREASGSYENHTTLSADPFQLHLKPGRYLVRAECGKEYVPAATEVIVTDQASPDERVNIELKLTRFANMAERGWYSGDTHVHRAMEELPTAMLADDLNVALPLNYWVRDSREIPSASAPPMNPEPQYIDATHVIYPVNTEYEIFTVDGKRHTQGAVFVLNHQQPLNLPSPPVLPVAEQARRQKALLDLDKHSWNWSMMIVPVMNVDLFELSNNHNWRTRFGFPQWTVENAPADWPEIERNDQRFTELGWTEFALQTYYALLNCGFRMRVTAGTGAGVHPVPLGHGRVYVHTGEEFSYERWIEGLDAGHSFVTTGPLIDVRFNGELPGTTWQADQSGNNVDIEGTIESLHPLKAIEVISNGRIVQTIEASPQQTSEGAFRYAIKTSVPLTGSGWVAIRCFEDLPDSKVSFAHTNPVFVDVQGNTLRARRRDVEFFIQRMDEEIQRNTGVISNEALAEYEKAKDIYTQILKQAAD